MQDIEVTCSRQRSERTPGMDVTQMFQRVYKSGFY